jgi:site-specific DNA recombinase
LNGPPARLPKREPERTVNATVKSSAPAETFTGKVQLEAQKRDIENELARLEPPDNVIALHPAAVTRYLETAEDIAATIATRAVDNDKVEAVRSLVERVTVQPQAKGDPLILDVSGRLAVLLGASTFPQAGG